MKCYVCYAVFYFFHRISVVIIVECKINSNMNIKEIKEKYTCLDYLGTPLKKTYSGWHIYRCPWKTDTHPSLTVSPDGKVWRDLSSGAEGGIIELVMAVKGTKDFREVCASFDSSSFSSSKTLDCKKERELEGSMFTSFNVLPLQSRGLYAYLSKRKINTTIARQLLQEAHYNFQERCDGKFLYALAYLNNKGGYELRSEQFKGGTAPKGITTHHYQENAPTVVFEGFMDMLSFVTLCGEIRHNYLVLNSIVNTDAAIEVLKKAENTVYLCLDNDKGGDEATKRILDELPSAIDIRGRFAPAKDVNDYLCSYRSVH